MSLKNKLLVFVLTLAASVGVIIFNSPSTFAATCYSSNGYAQDCTSGGGGRSCAPNCSSDQLISSRLVASVEISREDLIRSGLTSIPGISSSRSDLNFKAQTISVDQMAPGSTVWLNVAVAGKAGSYTAVDANGRAYTRTVQPGDILFAVPMSGAGSWSSPELGGGRKDSNAATLLQNRLSSLGVNGRALTSPEMFAKYQQLVAAGVQGDRLLDGSFVFNDFGGLGFVDGAGLENLSEQDILELLCGLGLCNPPETPVETIPRLSCHEGSHAGQSLGQVQVQNQTTGTGWTDLVWARPGDSVRFIIEFCWGAGAVGGSLGNASSPWAIFPGGRARTFGTPVTEVWFSLEATQNAKYLFGTNAQVVSGGTNGLRRYLTNPHQPTIGATGVGFSDNDVDRTEDYSFTLLSPSTKGEDSTKYNCGIFDFPPGFVNFGYHIPGVATGSCSAIANNGGVMSDVSDSEGIISQTIRYNRATAWQMWKRQEEGECHGCTQDPKSPQEFIRSKTIAGSIPSFNDLNEGNVNIRANPFQSYDQAVGTSGVWGLINKHGGDTAWHIRDCDAPGCGCSGWHSWCDDCCKRCTSYAEEGGCDSWETYGCYMGCTNTGQTWDGPCICQGASGPNYVRPVYDYSTGMQDVGEQSSTAKVNVPYSFRTSTTSAIKASDKIYLGEGVTSAFTASILPRIVSEVRPGEAYATLVDAEIRAVEFIVSSNDNLNSIEGSKNSPQDPCEYYKSKLNVIDGCQDIWNVPPMLNPEGRYAGKTYSQVVRRVVPDNRDDLVGARYCVAVGISKSDSHGGRGFDPDASEVSGLSSASQWRISGASCRTIAKKPNFQVWNGGFFTNGDVVTSLTSKHVNAKLGDSVNPTGTFGSWDEYYVVVNGNNTDFASGAALGYYGKERGTSLGLQGGTVADPDICSLYKMTISNEECYNAGNAAIYRSMEHILERIYSRYTNTTSANANGVSTLANGAVYVYMNGDLSTSRISQLSNAKSPLLKDSVTFEDSYIQKFRSNVIEESQQTTSNYASNTLVIYVTGQLTIDTNVCTGNGNCSIGNNGQSLALQNRNSDYYNSIFSIPQIIIIAKKGITVTRKVNQIDAWLITDGNINTCAEFSIGSGNADSCPDPLIVNGPVFAESLSLNRTAGANPGSGTNDRGSRGVLYENLANDGSITPGEIFNLRPDTLYWAYGQSQRFSQANVTYTRELAPRY